MTMGALFWQLNDCWPVASWSSVDYYGRPKALQFYARRFYAPVLASPHVEDGALKVHVVSDRTKVQNATLRVRLMDFDGRVLLEELNELQVAAQSSTVALTWPMKKILSSGATDLGSVFVVAELTAGDERLSRNVAYLTPVKNIRLKPAQLKVETAGGVGSYKIRVSSAVLARDVALSFGNLDVKLSDNFFDLLPGETVEIAASSQAGLDAVKANLKVISLTDAFALVPQRATLGAAR